MQGKLGDPSGPSAASEHLQIQTPLGREGKMGPVGQPSHKLCEEMVSKGWKQAKLDGSLKFTEQVKKTLDKKSLSLPSAFWGRHLGKGFVLAVFPWLLGPPLAKSSCARAGQIQISCLPVCLLSRGTSEPADARSMLPSLGETWCRARSMASAVFLPFVGDVRGF